MTMPDSMEGPWWVLCQVKVDSLPFLSAKVNTMGQWFPGVGRPQGTPTLVGSYLSFYEHGLIN